MTAGNTWWKSRAWVSGLSAFWVGPRLTGVFVAYKPEFLEMREAAYFLDSFRLEEKVADPPENPSGSPRRSP